MGTDQIEDGLARAIAMVEMASLQILSGVDYATVWPVQQNTRGDLAGNEGQTAENSASTLSEDGLTLAGEAFQMMSEVLPGMKILDVGGPVDLDGKRESDWYSAELLVRAYEDAEKIVVFASAWALDDALGAATLKLDLQGAFTSYDVTTLTVVGEKYTNPNADPVTLVETGLTVDDELTITFNRSYELQRLTIFKDESAGSASISPNSGFAGVDNNLVGSASDELLIGEEDVADGVWGKGGDDMLYGLGAGDQLNGGAGSDSLYGGDGFDLLQGGGGLDRLYGGMGGDILSGAADADRLRGQKGEDTLKGGGGDDTLLGGRQADKLFGGAGRDVLKGGDGDDELNGAVGNDVLKGGAGADRLVGGKGADILKGGGGDDIIETGPGADLAYGGAGADIFAIRQSDDIATVMDFDSRQDQFIFSHVDGFVDLTIRNTSLGAEISGGGVTFIAKGTAKNQIEDTDFIF